MHLRAHLEENRLFADDEAERNFRCGLEAAKARCRSAEGPMAVRPVVFDGIDPWQVGEALASLLTGEPVLLASRKWGSWTWSEVERLSAIPLEPGSVVIRTGGSTGEAKFAVHTWESLHFAAVQIWKRIRERPLSAVLDLPLHHVSGWMPVLRALVSGGRLFLAVERRDPCRLLCRSVVPTTLHRALRDKDRLAALKATDLVFAGAAPFGEALLDRARREEIRLMLVYGMTETAGMIGLQSLEDFWREGPPVMHPIGINAVAVADDGEIWVRSLQLFSGYWGRGPVVTEKGWWRTGDLGEWGEEGGFRPIGRKGRFVESGGETISMERVERVISRLPGVEDFWLGAVPDAEWGTRLILYLVSGRQADWKSELKQCLDPGEVPGEVRVVERIPRTVSGKVDPDRLFG